jgi:ADP-heptose:LPS heptosyltransferase
MEKLLAIKLRRLGDTVLWTSALRGLAKAYPDARLDVVVPRVYRELLIGEPYINKVYGVSPHVVDRLAVASRLRLLGYDRVLVFHSSPSSEFFGRMIGGARASAHSHEIGKTDFVVKPATERDCDTVRLAGLKLEGQAPEPALTFTDVELAAGKAWVQSSGLKPPILGVGLGASRPTKQWPLDRMAEIVRDWSARTSGSALIVCSSAEARAAKEFWKLLRHTPFLPLIDAPVRELAVRIAQVAAFVGNDSGPRHLAAAVGVRTVTLFGPEDPLEWHPYDRSKHPICFVGELECRKSAAPGMPPWCGIETCIEQKHRCMSDLSIEQVQKQLQQVMA